MLVPDVLVDSHHVLVTEWVDGTPLSRIIASGTQEERDEAATLYLEFLLRGPNRARLLHADPHPGNFRVTDGRPARGARLRRRQPAPARAAAGHGPGAHRGARR